MLSLACLFDFKQAAVIKQVLKNCVVKYAYLLVCIEMEGFMPGSAPPTHIARTERTSAQAQHTALPRLVITNRWALYMAAILDAETADGLGGPLGWWRHIPRTYVQAVSSLSPQIPSESNVHAVFERYTLKFCTRVECSPAEPFTNGWVYYFAYTWPDIRVLYFSGCLSLKRSHASGEIFVFRNWLGRGT